MDNFKRINDIVGWLVFAIATTVYFLTLEPTASWWDCGEYIATAYKLQVGHPPGAPLFQLLGRIFSLFAFGNVENVALMINIMSALSSSFTVLFLFWSITMLGKKIYVKASDTTLPAGQAYAVLGAGVVGALAYTFSDSFWFSAVEGEVYAMSSFFTAVVFWAILRWEEVADQRAGYRWLLLIAYMVGLIHWSSPLEPAGYSSNCLCLLFQEIRIFPQRFCHRRCRIGFHSGPGDVPDHSRYRFTGWKF